jgi:four helix bundle protein
MEEKAHQIAERLLDYGVEIVKLTTELIQTAPGKVIAKQILRSGTSIGANYEEACGAQSKADFIHTTGSKNS